MQGIFVPEPMDPSPLAPEPKPDVTMGEYLSAKFGQSTEDYNVGGRVIGSAVAQGDPLSRKFESYEEWEASPYRRDGIEFEDGWTEGRAAFAAGEYDKRREREDVINRSSGFFRSVLGFGAMIAGQALDPINYVPVVGWIGKGARVAKLNGLARALTATGTVRNAALMGMADAALSTAIAEPFLIDSLAAQGEEVGFTDGIFDVAMSGLAGGVMGGGLGLLARASARAEVKQTAFRSLALAADDLANGRPVDISGIRADYASARAVLGEDMARASGSPELSALLADAEPLPPKTDYTTGVDVDAVEPPDITAPKPAKSPQEGAAVEQGIDPATGDYAEADLLQAAVDNGKVLESEKAEIMAADTAVKNTAKRQEAYLAAAECVMRAAT
jgi:hypothetical protein